VGISASIPFGISWAQVNPTFVTTPGTIRVRFDATNLTPGVYSTTMTLTANRQGVQNVPYEVLLQVTVVPPVLEPRPASLSIYRLPCETDPCSPEELAERSAPFTRTVEVRGSNDLTFRAAILDVPDADEGQANSASAGLTGSITGGEVDDHGNIVLYDDRGNSRTLDADLVSAAATLSTTVMLDPAVTWITTATVDSPSTPALISIGFDPAVLTEDYQREYAVLVLVADTRAGTPPENVTIVPIELANIGYILWGAFLSK
jgi:hypothetical protein